MKTPPRRGFLLMEVIVAAAVFGALLTVCLQLVSAAAAQRRAAQQRAAALTELGNVMERLATRPWPELTAAAAAEKLPPDLAARLPGAVLHVAVATPAAEPAARQVTATLSWEDRNGKPVAPLRLTTWRYRRGGK